MVVGSVSIVLMSRSCVALCFAAELERIGRLGTLKGDRLS
jgi:hypothetical protein